nr:hypothetical protein [Candidatus Woesearchaeota archaeon]
MKSSLIVIALFLLFVPIVFSEDAKPVPIAYCEHMGYEIQIDSENKPVCVFEDGTSCNPSDFYYGNCSIDKRKDTAPRKERESVYVEFEKCEEGLIPSEPKYLLDQPVCENPPGALKKFFNFLSGFF